MRTHREAHVAVIPVEGFRLVVRNLEPNGKPYIMLETKGASIVSGVWTGQRVVDSMGHPAAVSYWAGTQTDCFSFVSKVLKATRDEWEAIFADIERENLSPTRFGVIERRALMLPSGRSGHYVRDPETARIYEVPQGILCEEIRQTDALYHAERRMIFARTGRASWELAARIKGHWHFEERAIYPITTAFHVLPTSLVLLPAAPYEATTEFRPWLLCTPEVTATGMLPSQERAVRSVLESPHATILHRIWRTPKHDRLYLGTNQGGGLSVDARGIVSVVSQIPRNDIDPLWDIQSAALVPIGTAVAPTVGTHRPRPSALPPARTTVAASPTVAAVRTVRVESREQDGQIVVEGRILQVERGTTAGLPYFLHGPKGGLWGLMRSKPTPSTLFVTNANNPRANGAIENRRFSDADGTLVLLAK